MKRYIIATTFLLTRKNISNRKLKEIKNRENGKLFFLRIKYFTYFSHKYIPKHKYFSFSRVIRKYSNELYSYSPFIYSSQSINNIF